MEEYIFNEAKKDKVAKELYKEVDTMKENFDVLITNVQEQSKLKSNMKEVETKTDDFRVKYKNGVEIEKLVGDLAEIKQENQYLSEKAKVWSHSFLNFVITQALFKLIHSLSLM